MATKIRCNNNGANNYINAISTAPTFNDLFSVFFSHNNLIMIIRLEFRQKKGKKVGWWISQVVMLSPVFFIISKTVPSPLLCECQESFSSININEQFRNNDWMTKTEKKWTEHVWLKWFNEKAVGSMTWFAVLWINKKLQGVWMIVVLVRHWNDFECSRARNVFIFAQYSVDDNGEDDVDNNQKLTIGLLFE